MTLEECYLSILKNSNSWNPTKSVYSGDIDPSARGFRATITDE